MNHIPQVAYQRILQLTYVDDLLAALKTLFIKLFQPFLASFVASLHAINSGKALAGEVATQWNFAKALEGWDAIFDKLLRGLEDKAAQVRQIHLLGALFMSLTGGWVETGQEVPSAHDHASGHRGLYSAL